MRIGDVALDRVAAGAVRWLLASRTDDGAVPYILSPVGSVNVVFQPISCALLCPSTTAGVPAGLSRSCEEASFHPPAENACCGGCCAYPNSRTQMHHDMQGSAHAGFRDLTTPHPTPRTHSRSRLTLLLLFMAMSISTTRDRRGAQIRRNHSSTATFDTQSSTRN